MSYANLLQRLLDRKLVTLRNMPAPNGRLPANYDANARCEFHSGGVGHNIENCYAFKCKVQDLLDSQQINFIPNPNTPNVVNQPMPPHGGGAIVNAVLDSSGEVLNSVMDVNLVTTPLTFVKRYLLDNNIFPGCGPDCCKCQVHVNGCDKLKMGIQFLIDEGSLQFDRGQNIER